MKLIPSNKCQICGRKLTTSTDIGPECAANYAAGIQAAGSSYGQIERLESVTDTLTGTWTRLAKQAMGQAKIGLAKIMLERAERRARLVTPPCDECYGTGLVYEGQDTDATGATFTAEVPCGCQKSAPVIDSGEWCETHFSSDCAHAAQLAA